MSDLYPLPAGYTLTVEAGVREASARQVEDETIAAVVQSGYSYTFGPYLVDRSFLVDGDAAVSSAAFTTSFGNLITTNAGAPVDAVQASKSINPTGDDNAIVFTARDYGTAGNSITVQYVDPGADSALSVSAAGPAITVTLAYAEAAITSTAAEVLAAIEADPKANSLVSVALDATDSNPDDGSGVVTAIAKTALADGAGTGIGIVSKGGLILDTTNGALYQNTGTKAAPAYSTNLNVVNGAPSTVDIALAAGAANVMQITMTVQDAAGNTLAGVYEIEWWISDATTGIGLTADSFSGDVATTTGTEWEERTSKKHYTGLTDVNGVIVATVTDTNTPADIYVAARNPLTGAVIVSAASGTSWGV